jgi:hypothetical protein
MSYVVASIVGGVLEFHREPPPPGTSNQAVVFQETGLGFSGGSPILATFDLGNSSTERKRVSVLVLDSDFSDLHVCTFWIPPNQPLKSYAMQTHTTEPWSNASIYFYAASEGSAGGAYRIDNVSLRYAPALFNDWTDCVDPNAPPAPGGSDGPDMIVNGGFSTGTLAPWGVFGTLTSRIFAGMFEFTRPTATPPAGVVLQATGQSFAANEIFAAFFSLGNTTNVRKRVTAIAHDNDFGDLAACTFWVPPQQFSPAPYALATFATRPWSNATISIYAATIGPEQWTRLDSVAMARLPSLPVTGTSCFEPAALTGPVHALAREMAAVATRAAEASAALATPSVAPSARWEIDTLIQLPDTIDLTNASAARLTFQSWMPSSSAVGAVQVSRDGANWAAAAEVAPSASWHTIAADLDAWLGHRIAVRFVQLRASATDRTWVDAWRIRNLEIEIEGRKNR